MIPAYLIGTSVSFMLSLWYFAVRAREEEEEGGSDVKLFAVVPIFSLLWPVVVPVILLYLVFQRTM